MPKNMSNKFDIRLAHSSLIWPRSGAGDLEVEIRIAGTSVPGFG
jgi:hypothetical protein